MIRAALPFALSLAALSAPVAAGAQAAQLPPLSLEHRMLLRCSAAFSLVAFAQASGNERGDRYPDMREDGREFFVRASARVMDETGLDRTGVAAALEAEARDIAARGTLNEIMPACLPLLPNG